MSVRLVSEIEAMLARAKKPNHIRCAYACTTLLQHVWQQVQGWIALWQCEQEQYKMVMYGVSQWSIFRQDSIFRSMPNTTFITANECFVRKATLGLIWESTRQNNHQHPRWIAAGLISVLVTPLCQFVGLNSDLSNRSTSVQFVFRYKFRETV
jgi:hypothetical protein